MTLWLEVVFFLWHITFTNRPSHFIRFVFKWSVHKICQTECIEEDKKNNHPVKQGNILPHRNTHAQILNPLTPEKKIKKNVNYKRKQNRLDYCRNFWCSKITKHVDIMYMCIEDKEDNNKKCYFYAFTAETCRLDFINIYLNIVWCY